MNKLLQNQIQRLKSTYNKIFGPPTYNLEDRVVFIHINKTGGSSVKNALKLPRGHRTALEEIQNIGREEWDKRFTFAFVRNPWEKVVSHYHFRVKTNRTNLAEKKISFKKWVKLTYGEQDPHYYNNPKMFQPQIKWVSDEQGNILVDQIYRFEKLNEHFDELCRQLNIKAKLPYLKKSKHVHYSTYYDDESRQIIEEWFAEDIEKFEYTFTSETG